MKDKLAIEAEINKISEEYKHVLAGSLATIGCNAPRALMQLAGETRLRTLCWVLGKKYKSRLKGIDR